MKKVYSRLLGLSAIALLAGGCSEPTTSPTGLSETPVLPVQANTSSSSAGTWYALGSPAIGDAILAGKAVMELFTIDPASGAATLVGSTGEVGLRGLAAHPTTGYLYSSYGSFRVTSNRGIVRIDASTGAVTPIGGTEPFVSLAFDSGGNLYGVRNPSVGGLSSDRRSGFARIFKIDVTSGDATEVAQVDFEFDTGWQIAFNSADELYFKDLVYRTWRVDLTSGTADFLGIVDDPAFFATLAWDFDSSDNAFHAGHPFDDEWGTLDLGALTATQTGNTGIWMRGLSYLGGGEGGAGEGENATFLLIDEESIKKGEAPNFFDESDVNEDIATLGLRSQLPFFAAAAIVGGVKITLHTGEVGDEGWFALKTIPASWDEAVPTGDGVHNFVGNPSLPFPHEVGPGLGAGDDPEALLDKIPDVTPLRATGLKLLEGKDVCAVVYKGDVSINYDPLDGSLKGDNLGTVAFNVVSVTELKGFSSSSLPQVEIMILDAEVFCGPDHDLGLFTDAPDPISSSEPFDVTP